MRVIYDSITASLIPNGTKIITGYVTGKYAWSPADWARFPHAAHVRIDVNGTKPFGSDVIDVERYDMTPGGAALWVRKRQETYGWWSAAYVSLFNLSKLRRAIGELQCVYWVAEWNDQPHLLDGPHIVAGQYANTPNYDLSIVTDKWFPTPAAK